MAQVNFVIPDSDRYWLRSARIPACLLDIPVAFTNQFVRDREGLLACDLMIQDGKVAAILPAGKELSMELSTELSDDLPTVHLRNGIVLPCFVNLHAHLDKNQTWPRSPNLEGGFAGAIKAIVRDCATWTYEDVYRRMEFGLKCSYAHGIKAIRTHIDCPPPLIDISLKAFCDLRKKWRDRLNLQVVSLVTIETYEEDFCVRLADRIAEIGGVLGGFAYLHPNNKKQIERIFELAEQRDLALDFHVDENDDPQSDLLKQVAEAALARNFSRQIVCGHCCSLSVQTESVVKQTIALVKQANIGIVSLPLCNLFLQARSPAKTPFWRGVTQIHELKNDGVAVAIATDNCHDPFYAYGDHDLLEIFRGSVHIAHLDQPFGDWIATITKTPAALVELPDLGKIYMGSTADLLLFKARTYTELIARAQSDRIVLRAGKAIDTTLPDYAELDDLLIENS